MVLLGAASVSLSGVLCIVVTVLLQSLSPVSSSSTHLRPGTTSAYGATPNCNITSYEAQYNTVSNGSCVACMGIYECAWCKNSKGVGSCINLGAKFPTKPDECKYLYSGTEAKYLGLCNKKSRFSPGEIAGMVLATLAAGALLHLFLLGSEGRAQLYRRVGDAIRGRHTPVQEEAVINVLNQDTAATTAYASNGYRAAEPTNPSAAYVAEEDFEQLNEGDSDVAMR